MIIDSFTFVGDSLSNHEARLLRPLEDATSGEKLVAILDRAGIDRAVVFPPRWIGGSAGDPEYRSSNAAVADAVRQFPDRLIGGARVNPNYDSAKDVLIEALESYGFRQLLLDVEWDNIEPDDTQRVHPLVELVHEHGGALVLESGWAPANAGVFWDLADTFSETPVILAHMGFRLFDDAVKLCQRLSNVYLETSDSLHPDEVIDVIGADRILFGSSAPFGVPEAELIKITFGDRVSEEHKAQILGENAVALYKLDVGQPA